MSANLLHKISPVALIATLLLPISVQAQDANESDPYADEVVSWAPGNPATSEGPSEPAFALGAPNFIDYDHYDTIATLGCGGQLVVRFTDNHLYDGDGADLKIYEAGDPEVYLVEISADGNNWRTVGEKPVGGTAEFDIGK